MHFSSIIAASLVAPLAAAHGGVEGAPSVFGMPKQLRASNLIAGYQARHAASRAHVVESRQAGAERCGPDNGGQMCAKGECCSGAGYCGTTPEHCQAPDCLFNYGSGCDANKTPAGESTRNEARPQLGSIPYGGAGIYVCNNPGTVAITYDDGPYIYTEGVMDLFKAKGAHATFFLTGININKGAIDENWSGVINRMYNEGHQVASHTWSHQDLSLITEEEAYDQMVKNEMAIRNILGKYPTYMRPPYSSCNAVCQNVLKTLGYVVSYFDLDTADYLNLTPEKIQTSKDRFKDGIDTRNIAPYDGDRLVIGHDIHQLTAENLTAYMLDYIYDQGLTAVTMGECLNDPKENWYRDSTPAPPSTTSSTRTSSAVPTPTGPTSTDGSCGASANGQSCVGFFGVDGLLGECCSQYGWCGRTSDHCQTGCQAGFGKCGAQPSASSSASAPVSTSASATGPIPTPTGPTSTDGSCGANGMGQSCIGFVGPAGLGECCSEYGYCGNTDIYCSTGCQLGFGKCGAQSTSSGSAIAADASSFIPATSSQASSSSSALASSGAVSSSIDTSSGVMESSSVVASSAVSHVSSAPSATPTTSGEMSRDGSCGGQKGYTCVGFSTLEGVKSECCSQWGYCGSSADHCGAGCNPIYGNCPSVSSSALVSSKLTDATSSAISASLSDVHSSSVASVSASGSSVTSVSASISASNSTSKNLEEHPSTSIPVSVYSTEIYSASASLSASKDGFSSASISSDYPVSTPAQSEASSTITEPSSSAIHPSESSIAVSTSIASSVVSLSASLTQFYPSGSKTPIYSTGSVTPIPVYPASSFSTAIVKPSSTPYTTSSAKPTPTGPIVSKNGKCGSANGGQTCAGYKSPWGVQMGCCCKQSGRCSIDPWSCGIGCDEGYGKCWF